MHSEEVKRLLSAEFADCVIDVSSEGSHFNILIVGSVFESLSRVRRQQLVYSVLNDNIISGEIHAVNLRLFTQQEYTAQ